MPGVQDALHRFGGMYGSAYRNGFQLAEAVEVMGNVAVARIEVPMVGVTKQGYKAGRETREGTMRVQKIDSSWELEIYEFLSQSLAQRRLNRGTSVRTFSLKLENDDPEAYDKEQWQIDGVQIWQMPLGFSITDDIVNREFPITWAAETPLHVFQVDRTTGAVTDRTPTATLGYSGTGTD